jgi:prepilin-type N-terminal cleavage/methylation domain-containing protein
MTDKFRYRLGVKLSGQMGFTLLETMIGMMIFAVGITAVLSMQMTAINAHTTSRAQVVNVHDAVLQSETVVPAYLYNDEEMLGDDGGNFTTPDTYDAADMPVKGNAYASYSVRNGYIVSQVKMVYLSNKRNANDLNKFTLRLAVPDIGRVK